jgi:hypothetical protein
MLTILSEQFNWPLNPYTISTEKEIKCNDFTVGWSESHAKGIGGFRKLIRRKRTAIRLKGRPGSIWMHPFVLMSGGTESV